MDGTAAPPRWGFDPEPALPDRLYRRGGIGRKDFPQPGVGRRGAGRGDRQGAEGWPIGSVGWVPGPPTSGPAAPRLGLPLIIEQDVAWDADWKGPGNKRQGKGPGRGPGDKRTGTG